MKYAAPIRRFRSLGARCSLLLLSGLLVTSGCRETGSPASSFDGARAQVWVERQVAHGPRIPGTDAHAACLAELETELRSLTPQVNRHEAVVRGVALTNLVAAFRPELEERIFLVAHWDTRPQADSDPDPANRSLPVPGANDGGSGVAVLLEVARCLASEPPPRGVDIFLVDAEDGGTHNDPQSWCLGSAALAAALSSAGYRPRMGLVIDMVGDVDLRLPMEGYSLELAPTQTLWLWDLAAALGERAFVKLPGAPVFDDHLPFLQKGIPTVDIIDFEYEHWHTIADTPDKTSAASLATVGRVVLAAIYAKELPR